MRSTSKRSCYLRCLGDLVLGVGKHRDHEITQFLLGSNLMLKSMVSGDMMLKST